MNARKLLLSLLAALILSFSLAQEKVTVFGWPLYPPEIFTLLLFSAMVFELW